MSTITLLLIIGALLSQTHTNEAKDTELDEWYMFDDDIDEWL